MRCGIALASAALWLAVAGAVLADDSPDPGDKPVAASFEKNILGDAVKRQPAPADVPLVECPPASPAEAVLKKKIWSGFVEAGGNGSAGNTNTFDLRVGTLLKREVNGNIFVTDLLYLFSEVSGATTDNNLLLVVRDEQQIRDSKWALLGLTFVEYDQFKSFDVQTGAYGGVVRTILKGERGFLKARTGFGAVYRSSSTTGVNRWTPEYVIGGIFEYKLTERLGLVAGGDYFVDVTDLTTFRIRAKAAVEYLLSRENNLVIRGGVTERYDSKTNGSLPNDVDYFVTLAIRF